ncbi:glutamate--cysteine ligase [Trichomonascus vanleenenianus]|uniref:glutamate--cysteine ligase n=1 Tax=Trichomonascus vanleenenianus TaxID=2268995 RepID=UPI003ECB05AF
MGLLSLGVPLDWPEVKPLADYVRTHGIEQLINIYNRTKDIKGDKLLWGDEIESMVVEIDDEAKTAKLSLRQAQILDELAKAEKDGSLSEHNVSFHPEFGRFMLEATPARPFSGDFAELLEVEPNMMKRRLIAKRHMRPEEVPLNVTSYPMLGSGDFANPSSKPESPATRSLFVSDEVINPHPRFPTLTANIRQRRGSKVAINVPIFVDKNTPQPFIDDTIPWNRGLFPEDANARDGAAKPDHIYMDAMAFGMGCCCLQLTFQATDINEARNMYDQLAPLAPIFLAVSASAPAYRGFLSDQDARWNVISGSVDDRPPYERGLEPGKSETNPYNSNTVIPKSRYDSMDCYISNESEELKESYGHYNDREVVVNLKVKKRLLEAGFDENLATHFAHLFIRDPLVIFKELIDQDDKVDSDHFENIQSTNWQTMRFKPPPPGNHGIGWRVEFRSMDIQLTEFENAAFSVFIVLLTRAIISYNLNFYIPISKVDQAMDCAHKRDAVNKAKFWIRTNIYEHSGKPGEYHELYVNEIFNGCEHFTGLVPLVRTYLRSMNVDMDVLCRLERYISLVSKRASGELITAATWIRRFIRSHPAYKFDSKIPMEVNYDLMKAIQKVTEGQGWNDDLAKDLLGGFKMNDVNI